MGTGAAWSDVRLGESDEAWFSLYDIKDYFYAYLRRGCRAILV